MQQQTKIILFFLGLFIASSVYLFSIDSDYNNAEDNDDWYALYFTDPKSDSLDFTIKNFSGETNFHWEVLADDKKLAEQDISIPTDAEREFNPIKVNPEIKKYTIRVSAGDITQRIYKNLKK
jgi:hypothetical protein